MKIETDIRFHAPFCEEAEINYWLELLDCFAHKTQFGKPKYTPITRTFRTATGVTFESAVLWKDAGTHTGLCLTGEYAGLLIRKDGEDSVVTGRYIDQAGAEFNGEIALEKIETYRRQNLISTVVKEAIASSILAETPDMYPRLIVFLCKRLGYPIDEEKFLNNIRTNASAVNVFPQVSHHP